MQDLGASRCIFCRRWAKVSFIVQSLWAVLPFTRNLFLAIRRNLRRNRRKFSVAPLTRRAVCSFALTQKLLKKSAIRFHNFSYVNFERHTKKRHKKYWRFLSFLFFHQEWHNDPILVWLPVVEPEVPGVERFLEAQPIDLIREGKINDVPLITGITKDEFGGVVVGMFRRSF